MNWNLQASQYIIVKKIISRSIVHQLESIKVNWSSSGGTEPTKDFHDHFHWLHPKFLSIKNKYYNRKVRDWLEIDIAVVRYEQDKVLKTDNGKFVQTNAWKLKFDRRHFLLSDGFGLYFDQFENGFNHKWIWIWE